MTDKSKVKKSDLKLQQKVDELTEALQRERADSVNIRRRHEDQIASLQDMIKATVVKDLLPVIDNFERALKHTPKNLENDDFVKGIEVIVGQFEKSIQNMGVTRIATIGEEFDPSVHQAVSIEEGKGTKEIISEELQSGYKINNDVIRPAMVKVKKG